MATAVSLDISCIEYPVVPCLLDPVEYQSLVYYIVFNVVSGAILFLDALPFGKPYFNLVAQISLTKTALLVLSSLM